MFEDPHIFKFICIFLGVASIFTPGPIIPIIGTLIAIAMLIYKIKRAKEDGFEALMLDLVLIVIVLIIEIAFLAMRISIVNDYNKYNYSSNSSEEMTISDVAETAIAVYQLGNLSQFSDEGNHQSEIKSGFSAYLTDELGISDVSINGNKITCNIGTDTIIFTVTKNDIKYTIK